MNKKEYIKNIMSSMIDEYNTGDVDALDLYIEFKEIEKHLSGFISEISDEALKDAEKYGKGEHVRNGVIFGVRGGAGRFDFKHVPEWSYKKSELEKIESSLKALYNYAQQNPGQIVNTETGEIPILPAYNKAKDSLIIKFPK